MSTTHINRLRCSITNTPGTSGNVVVGAAPAGRRTFSAADDGKSFEPTFSEGNAWEVRTGCVYTHSTTTLTRGTLVDSSTGSAIALTSAAIVALHVTAKGIQDLDWAREGNAQHTVLAPIVSRETTSGGRYLVRHQPQGGTNGGYEFSLGYNGGAVATQGPTVEPTYTDDVWWLGMNSSGPDIPVDAAKPTFSLQFESKFAQGGATAPFGSEFHLAFKPVSGPTQRILTTFMPHDMSTALKRKGLTTGIQSAGLDIFDPALTSRLAIRFNEAGAGDWTFRSGEALNFEKLAGAAPLNQRNAGNTTFLPLPYYNGENRMMLGSSSQSVGATPTTGTYPDNFAVWQATSIAANGKLAYFQAPSVTGDLNVGYFAGSTSNEQKVVNYNASNTSNAHAVLQLLSREAGGDAMAKFESNGQRTWSIGQDTSANRRFVISKTYELGSTGDIIQIETTNVMFVANCTAAPGSNASGGGNLYVEAGALKWRGSSGTVTTLGAA